jgi:hypothetical protein
MFSTLPMDNEYEEGTKHPCVIYAMHALYSVGLHILAPDIPDRVTTQQRRIGLLQCSLDYM